jgi:hypothetical protein
MPKHYKKSQPQLSALAGAAKPADDKAAFLEMLRRATIGTFPPEPERVRL